MMKMGTWRGAQKRFISLGLIVTLTTQYIKEAGSNKIFRRVRWPACANNLDYTCGFFAEKQ